MKASGKSFKAIVHAVKIDGLAKRTTAKVSLHHTHTHFLYRARASSHVQQLGNPHHGQHGSRYHEPTYFKVSTLLTTTFLYKELFKLAPNGLLPNLKLLDALKIVASTGATPSLLQCCVYQRICNMFTFV